MRLWSLHPAHLDRVGLVALWREGLLAQAVLAGRTRGYTRHPQLERFRASSAPLATIGAYLAAVETEARDRGYRFDGAKVLERPSPPPRLEVTEGQLSLEREHLLAKLLARAPEEATRLRGARLVAHPLFRLVPGPVAAWERARGNP